MPSERITIGKMAELNGISVRMLRFYHEKGLLVPSCVDERTGYRSYALEQCATLDMIQQMQSLDIPLKQIKRILDRHDIDYVKEVLKDQLDSINERMRKLDTERKVCTALLDDYDIYQNQPVCDEIMLENLPERAIVRFPHEDGDAYAHNIDAEAADAELEYHLRTIKRKMIDEGYPLALFCNVGCIIPYERLIERDFTFAYSYVFVHDSDSIPDAERSIVPAGQFLTMYSSGTHYPDGRLKTIDDINRMLDYIDNKGMEVAGDYVDEVIAETPPFLEERWQMLYKLTIPVRKK